MITPVSKRSHTAKTWRLEDVIDLEVLQDGTPLWKNAWLGGVSEAVDDAEAKDESLGRVTSEKARRRLGLREMLEVVRTGEGTKTGQGVMFGAKVVEIVMLVVMFFAGVALVRGLLTEIPHVAGRESVSRGFNIWVFLAVTLGIQWVVLCVAFLGFCFRKQLSGSLSLFRHLLTWIITKLGRYGENIQNAKWMPSVGSAGFDLWGWRLTRMLQSGSIGFNVGMLVGLFGCLWFLSVSFFWETSLPQFGEQSLQRVTQVISSPVGGNMISPEKIEMANATYSDVINESDKMESMSPRMKTDLAWSGFFLFALAFWGLFPRILLWMFSSWKERRMLAGLDFQESSQRRLWREVTQVRRGVVSSRPADGVVILDIGGVEVSTETIRPFFLQELRLNPESRFVLGTLDTEAEKLAFEAAEAAAMGVVFLVEGWSLSPKQMTIYHQRTRGLIGLKQSIRYLVLGSEEEMAQWEHYVDGLKDAECDVTLYDRAIVAPKQSGE